MSEDILFEQQNMFEGDPPSEPKAKPRRHAGTKKPAKKVETKQVAAVSATEQIKLPENPIIIESIRQAEAFAQDMSMHYNPVKIKQAIVAQGLIDDMLINSTAMQAKVREEAEEAEEQIGKSAKAVTMSEEVLSPIMKSTGLTAFDRAVLEAIYSQLMASEDASNAIFTLRGIFRTMCGSTDKEISMSKAQQERIMGIIVQLMSTVVVVEVDGVTSNGEKAKVENYLQLLPCVMQRINIGGAVTTAVRVLSNPPFLAFASGQRGLATTPLQLLDIPISATERNLSIINYLQHQYTAVVYAENSDEARGGLDSKNELFLAYEPIYEIAEVKPLKNKGKEAGKKYTSTYMKRVRDVVHTILDNWQDKGFIVSWDETCQGGGKNKEDQNHGIIVGVTLHLPESAPPVS